jgi:hypothetical protein
MLRTVLCGHLAAVALLSIATARDVLLDAHRCLQSSSCSCLKERRSSTQVVCHLRRHACNRLTSVCNSSGLTSVRYSRRLTSVCNRCDICLQQPPPHICLQQPPPHICSLQPPPHICLQQPPPHICAEPYCLQTPVKAVNNTDPINKWARDKTGGRITQSVPPGTPFDLVVTNAVYFRCKLVKLDKQTMNQMLPTCLTSPCLCLNWWEMAERVTGCFHFPGRCRSCCHMSHCQ